MTTKMEALNFLRMRYSVVLGEKSFLKLFYFYFGFDFALSQYNLDDDTFDGRDFTDWLRLKFKFGNSTMISWVSYIQNTKPDDGEAFDYFFELLDMYIEEKLVT